MNLSNQMKGAAAFLFGAAIAVAGSAFTPSESRQDQQLYGRLSNGEWVNIQDDPSRQCNASSNVCKAFFDSQPAQNAIPASGDIVEDNGTLQ